MTYSTSKESPNHQIVFLVYTARSGSTFLASALDSFEEIGVSIEDSIPGGLAFVDEFSDNFHSLLTAFQQDIKFKSWNILSNDLKQILEIKYFHLSSARYLRQKSLSPRLSYTRLQNIFTS